MKKIKEMVRAFMGRGPEVTMEFKIDIIHIVIFICLVVYACWLFL